MLHKDFILDVQKMCHQDNQQCTLLLNALCRMMSQAGVEQVPVTIPGLGTFSSHKHPEYIQEDPMTGRQTLYPPRITYRMQTEDEDAPEGLVQRQLSELSHISIEETSAFLAAMVQVIYQALDHGQEVEVKGLGTFRNIVTRQGELQRVAYMPDEQMRQRVNAPFDCFEPVAIATDASPKIEPTPEEPQTIPEDKPQTTPEDKPQTISEDDSQIMVETVMPTEPEIIAPVTLSEGMTTSTLEPVEETVTPVEKAPETASEQSARKVEDPLVERDMPQPARGRKKSQSAALYMIVALVLLICGAFLWFIYSLDNRTYGSDNGNPPVYTSYDIDQSDSDLVMADSLANDSDAVLSLEEELYGEVEIDSMMREDNQDAELPELLAAAEPQPEASSAPSAATPSSANPSALAQPAQQPVTSAQPTPQAATPAQPLPQPAADAASHTLMGQDGRPVTHKLEAGQMLTQVALKYYGDKSFWPYIYEVNKSKIRNPNIVPAGIVLNLPDPAFFGIDANNPESVRRAKAKASALVNAQ